MGGLYRRAMPSPKLLEREVELAQLRAAVAALQGPAPQGANLVLLGDAGVGKTSLLRQARQECGAEVDWLWGTCEPLLAAPPLAPLIDWLDRLPPGLAAAVRQGRTTPDVLAGMLALLRERTRPLVLVIDDAQWVDSATLDLLRYLGRRVDGTRALLVLSARRDGLAAASSLPSAWPGRKAWCQLRCARPWWHGFRRCHRPASNWWNC